LFHSLLMGKKLECLSLASLYSLGQVVFIVLLHSL
jgi:hypothetical protein